MADDQTGYPGTDVIIKKLGDKQATKDLKTLCKSKHSVVIGLTPPPTADSPATPYETSIAVLFTASDTSGAGLVGEAYTKLLFDPLEYEKTVAQGLDIVWGRDNQTVGDYTEAVAYTGTYIVTAPVRAVAAAGNALVKGVASLFGAENFSGLSERKADTWGTDLHYEDASAHKIRIQIFNTPPNGTRRQVYDSELAGSSESVSVGDREFVKPAVAYFAIDAPGKWEVFIDSIGSGTCANPKLKFSKSFTVEPLSETQPESLVSVDTDGDGIADGAETLVSTQGSRGTATSVPTVGLETIVGGTLLTGVFLYALLAPRRE